MSGIGESLGQAAAPATTVPPRFAAAAYRRRLLGSDFFLKVSETLATRGFTFCVGLAISVFTARALGPAGRGTYATALVLTTLGVQFGNFGLHAANTFFVAKDRSLLRGLVTNAVVVSVVVGVSCALILWAVSKVWPTALPLHGIELAFALIGIPFGVAYLLLQNLLLGCYQIRDFNRIEILNRSTNLLLLLGLAVFVAMTPAMAISASLIAAALGSVLCFVSLVPRLRLAAPSWRLFQKTFSYGCRPYLNAIFGFAVLKADLLLVARILGAREAGFYSVAVNLGDVLYVLPATVGSVLFPKLARMTSHREKVHATIRVFAVVGTMMAVLSVIIALSSRYVIPLMYGAEFRASTPAFNWLLPGMVCMSLTSVLSAYVASEYIPWAVVWTYVAMSVVDIGVNLLWLPKMGIVGAAQLSSACYLGVLIGVLFVARGIAREAR